MAESQLILELLFLHIRGGYVFITKYCVVVELSYLDYMFCSLFFLNSKVQFEYLLSVLADLYSFLGILVTKVPHCKKVRRSFSKLLQEVLLLHKMLL